MKAADRKQLKEAAEYHRGEIRWLQLECCHSEGFEMRSGILQHEHFASAIEAALEKLMPD